MPLFSDEGHDCVICQTCSRLVDTGVEAITWRPDLTGNESAGNVCESCIEKNDEPLCMGCGTRCGSNGKCME